MKQKELNRLLSLLLVFCLLVGLFPGIGTVARAAEPALEEVNTPVAASARAVISDEEALLMAIKTCPNGATISLAGVKIELSQPISIPAGKIIHINGLGSDECTITPASIGNWALGSSALFELSEGAHLILSNLTLDGNTKTRGIMASKSGCSVELQFVNVTRGVSDAQSGGGIYLNGNDITLNVGPGCTFSENKALTGSPTAGGAIYSGPGSTVTLLGSESQPIRFYDNEAHSGGCIYAYKSYVLAAHCAFGVPGENPNHAGQRGGAIHCHGTMVLKNCMVENNTSDQYGGGIYVSASAGDFNGMVLLDNTTVINNNATNSGGGIFVASNSGLFLKGHTTVSGNCLKSVEGEWTNNIHYTNESGKIIICDEQVGEIGVSTVSPTFRKLAMYTCATALKERLEPFSDEYIPNLDNVGI